MKHILIVNGHDDSRHILRTALTHRGYRVTDVANSQDALRTARSEQPDLVILELYLHPVDGHGLIRALRSQDSTAAIPIICLTSRVMEADRQAALAAGADVFLPKPLTPTQVIRRVEKLLDLVAAK
jgi:DNA-binding response OmpR family regulator